MVKYSDSYTAGVPFFGSPASGLAAPVSPVLDPTKGHRLPPSRKPKSISQRMEELQRAAETLVPQIVERRLLIDSFTAAEDLNSLTHQESDAKGSSKQRACSINPDLVIPVKFNPKGRLNEQADNIKKAAVRNANHIAERRDVLDAYHSRASAGLAAGLKGDQKPEKQARPASASQRSRTTRSQLSTGRAAGCIRPSSGSSKRSYSASSLILSWPHGDLRRDVFVCPVSAWATIPTARC